MPEKLVIATRGSKLALWQAHHVADRLREAHPGLTVDLLPIKTKGDKILDVPLAKVGGKGLFVKESRKRCSTAGPTGRALHEGLCRPKSRLGWCSGSSPSERADRFASCPSAMTAWPPARRGQGRPRAACAARPSCLGCARISPSWTCAATWIPGLASSLPPVRRHRGGAAGCNRLGLSAPKMIRLGPPEFLPAAAQGALGLEYRPATSALKSSCLFRPSRQPRCRGRGARLPGRLEGGCQVPIAAHAV
jgi:hydroxymethylbilane synthase